MEVFYKIPSYSDEYFACESRHSFNHPAWVAEACAKDAYYSYVGPDAEWPLVVHVYEAPYPESKVCEMEVDFVSSPKFFTV